MGDRLEEADIHNTARTQRCSERWAGQANYRDLQTAGYEAATREAYEASASRRLKIRCPRATHSSSNRTPHNLRRLCKATRSQWLILRGVPPAVQNLYEITKLDTSDSLGGRDSLGGCSLSGPPHADSIIASNTAAARTPARDLPAKQGKSFKLPNMTFPNHQQ